MKTLYFECNMGAAGDMLMAALLELIPDKDAAIEKLNNLGLEDVHVTFRPEAKCGIFGTHVNVHIHGQEEHSHDVHEHEHDHGHSHEHGHSHDHTQHTHDHKHGEHSHSHDHSSLDHDHGHSHSHGNHTHDHNHSALDDIAHTISHMPVSEQVKQNATAVYALIAQAESHAHGVPVSEIHFHEVGTLDAIVDVVGVCYLIELLAPEQILASPIHVGSGQVRCAHGILPVPAPATAYILKDVPIYGGRIKGELCTPTGAALLKHFVQSFGDMPVMRTEKIGYGMGTKNFEDANCIRAYLGYTQDSADDVVELSCNLDDMTGEAIGYATEVLLDAGALDVYTTPIYMKKNRPGIMLCVLCKKADADVFAALLLKHTTTIGVRKQAFARYTLDRSTATHTSSLGEVRMKSSNGLGASKVKPEYEDIAKIAKEKNLSYSDVLMQIVKDL